MTNTVSAREIEEAAASTNNGYIEVERLVVSASTRLYYILPIYILLLLL